ncbi:putative cytochrome P450 hydroxylase [Collimonas arenae]|uniref:Putative cytochrome P450 hydroxylase n=1 Tax=Collimonas arenae TaxID=279058 RepID=A0A0A1FM18_9BURK|nr:cytochrome P450 [Collimonas arenae]AIY44012.1 putative cytochrome P450 hydroxylase [Collimonas arenae]
MINEAFLNDPYPAYHALRAEGALHWSPEFCGGAWLLTGHADVASVLRDPRFSVRRAGGWANSSGPGALNELREFKRIFSRSLLFVDAPQHTRLRQVMNAGFKPAALQELAPQIQIIVDRLLDDILSKAGTTANGQFAEFDFMHDFARPLPALVIASMLGIAAEDRSEFVAWSDDIAAFIGSPTPTLDIARAAQVSLIAMNDYFRQLLPQRRAALGDDLMSQLIRAEANGGIITTKELLAQCCTLLFAGHETTRNLLGNGMLALLQHPQQWQALQAAPSLLPSALKELLRFDSPVQYTGRRLKVDVEMHGQLMKKGDLVIPLIGAANRDPAKYTDPDRLDIQRNEGAHLSFGYGPHVCIGATLTYLEAEIAMRSVMQRLPQLRLASATQSWGVNAVYRSLNALSLQFSPPAPAAESPVVEADYA